MAYPKIANLVIRLYRKTANNDITWAASDVDRQFQKSFSSYSVRVSMEDDYDHRGNEIDNYFISIFDSTGNIIERVSQTGLRDELESLNYSPSLVQELYELARRQALGVESALDSIISELDELDEL